MIATLVAAGADVNAAFVGSHREPRIIELSSHRFYVGTLFVPQTSSTPATPHPIVDAFLNAANDAGARTS